MSEGGWIWLAVIAGAIIWVLRSMRGARAPYVTREAPPPPVTSKRQMAPEELEVERARHAFEETDRARGEAQRQHHRDTEAVRTKLERAREYVRKSGLDQALPTVWEEIEHWGTWVNMPDEWSPPDGVTEIRGGEGSDESYVSWKWHGHVYRMQFRRRRSYTPDGDLEFAEIDLIVDGEPAITLDCTKDGYETWEQWRGSDVKQLRVGPWMSDIIRFAGHLKLTSERQTWQFFAEADEQRARRIDLGDDT
jgi:hypothetical protein